MQTSELHSLNRLLPRQDLFKGNALRMFVWGTLSGILIIPIAISLLFLVQLVQTHGTLHASGDDWKTFAVRLSLEASDEASSGRVVINNSGLLATAWNTRETLTGKLAGSLVESLPALKTNRGATVTLVSALGLSMLLLFLCLERQQANLSRLVREVQARARRLLHRQALRLGQSDLEGTIDDRACELFDEETSRLGDALKNWLTVYSRLIPICAGLLFAGLLVDWLLFLLCLLPLEAGWLVWQQISRKAKEDRLQTETIAQRDLKLLKSGLGTARIVRGYGMQEFEQQQFQKLIDDYHHRQSDVSKSRRWTIRGTALLSLALVLGVAFVLATKMLSAPESDLIFARTLVVLALIGGISALLRDLSHVTGMLGDAKLSASKLFRFLDESPLVGQAVGAKFIPPVSRSIYFESVTYQPPGAKKPLLKNFDLKLEAGGVNAVIALDDNVPRALGWLLPRFIEPQSGRILFDGEDIAWATLESLRAETILVSGSDPLLNGTVLENLIGGGKEYSLQEATDAAKLARAHSFITRLPQGYETPLGVYGETLDAGQRFRLSLARAAMRKPAVLIVEEPSANFDEDTKSLLDDAYQRIFADRTVVLLPRRLSTVKKADKLIVLHEGKVNVIGTHASLVKNHELVRHWEYTRFNPFNDKQSDT